LAFIDGCQLHLNWSSFADSCSRVLVYNPATNASLTFNASDDLTHVIYPVDSASVLDVVFTEGCHGNLSSSNSTVIETKSTFPGLLPFQDSSCNTRAVRHVIYCIAD
jgi:hypothetical protein